MQTFTEHAAHNASRRTSVPSGNEDGDLTRISYLGVTYTVKPATEIQVGEIAYPVVGRPGNRAELTLDACMAHAGELRQIEWTQDWADRAATSPGAENLFALVRPAQSA